MSETKHETYHCTPIKIGRFQDSFQMVLENGNAAYCLSFTACNSHLNSFRRAAITTYIVLAVNNHAELVDCLKCYADPRKYRGPNGDPDPDEEAVAGCYRLDVTRDGGNKARTLLAKLEGGK